MSLQAVAPSGGVVGERAAEATPGEETAATEREGGLTAGRRAIAATILALLTLLVFLPALQCGFVTWDDPQSNPDYAPVLRGLSWEGVVWAFTETDYFANWLPLSILSTMLDFELFGEQAGGHHLTSIVLHALTVALVFLLFQRTTGHTGRAVAVAALWGLHPLRVEPVLWLAARKDMLSGVFGILTLLLYVRWRERPGAGRYLAIAAAYAAALMSKSMVVTLPAVMLLLDLWPLRRLDGPSGPSLRRLLPLTVEKLPFFAMAIATAAIAWATQRQAGAVSSLAGVPLAMRAQNALLAPARYLRDTFWPEGLLAFYPLRAATMPPSWVVGLAALLLVVLCGAAFAAWRRRPWLTVGWFWFLGMLMPVIGLVQLGGSSHADRYTYLPAIGLTLALVWAACELTPVSLRSALPAVAAVLCVACAWRTRVEIPPWRDSPTLYRHLLSIDPDNTLGHLNLGTWLKGEKKTQEALPHLRRAVELAPESMIARNDLGSALRAAGDLPGAMAELTEALRLDPDEPFVHMNMAIVLDDMGRPGAAAGHLATVIALRPGFRPAWEGLADVLNRPGVAAQAVPYIAAVAAAKPEVPELQQVLKLARERAARDQTVAAPP